ncbi:MAG TPA: hypothetical protein VHA35_21215 [Dongiaceae bacterium]|nr:hypothetical protein [Dongiaceae bacterium]
MVDVVPSFRIRLSRLAAGLVACLCLAAAPAEAHRTTTGPTTGISIPGLTHGQMAVIAEYRSQILALADRQPFDTDETFFRLRNYVELQYMYCLWGVVPGSVADESSPFNECSHAYLSGLQALLLHMRTMRGDQTEVVALIDRIELEMLAHNASMILCQYSNEPFNTADHVSPHWRDVPFHAPSLLTFLGIGSLGFSAGGLARRVLRGPAGRA